MKPGAFDTKYPMSCFGHGFPGPEQGPFRSTLSAPFSGAFRQLHLETLEPLERCLHAYHSFLQPREPGSED